MDRKEWLQWRKKGIGSSDAPIIMGVSPWKTPLQLYEEKISDTIDEKTSYIQQKGNQIEPKIRALFEFKMQKSFQPVLVYSEEHPELRASLDGRSEDGKAILEIKLVGRDDWEAAKNSSIIPQKYEPQVYHGLMVSGAEVCYYVCAQEPERGSVLTPDNLAIVSVFRSPTYEENLKKSCLEFWDRVQTKRPPLPVDGDFLKLKGVTALANKWKRLKRKLDDIQVELDLARKNLVAFAELENHPRCLAGTIKLVKTTRAGNIAYKDILELKGIDLEKYRGKETLYWRVGE